jgi:predicted nucleic acid-binding protein
VTITVVDASVVVAWFAREPSSGTARQVAASGDTLIAPAWLLLEVGNALVRKSIAGTVRRGFAGDVIRILRRRRPVALYDVEPLASHAAAIAEKLGHPIYDCVYLALSEREGATFATFDRELAKRADRLSIPLWAPEDAG